MISSNRVLSDDIYDQLVYLRIFEGCNLYCDHCFIPSNPKKMSYDLVSSVPDIIRKFSKEDAKILLQWHGGEPTALGKEHLLKCLNLVNDNKKKLNIINGIQTNLLNYDESWNELYYEHFDSMIGVSWDYLIRKENGLNKTNDEFNIKFWKNIEKLVNSNIQPYMVITGTKLFFERFSNGYELFNMLESRGIYNLHIERLTEVGNARENWNNIGVNNLEYSKYMSRLFMAYLDHTIKSNGYNKIRISPFDGLIESVLRLKKGESGGYGCLSGACDSKFHTIDSNGYKYGCTALNSEYDNKKSLSKSVEIIKLIDLTEARKERQLTCDGCSYKSICSSGCLATNKFDYSGECSGSKKLFDKIFKLV